MKFYELLDKLERIRKEAGNELLKQDIEAILVERNDTVVLKFGYDIIIPGGKGDES